MSRNLAWLSVMIVSRLEVRIWSGGEEGEVSKTGVDCLKFSCENGG